MSVLTEETICYDHQAEEPAHLAHHEEEYFRGADSLSNRRAIHSNQIFKEEDKSLTYQEACSSGRAYQTVRIFKQERQILNIIIGSDKY